MATRTNFYKNPSCAYNKQCNLNSVLQNLKSYNIATGNARAEESDRVVQRKRRRMSRPPSVRLEKVKENDGPMSHLEYIDNLRKEADSSQPYQELTADVLESSNSALNLVGYESDGSTSARSEEGQGPLRNFEDQMNSSNEIQYFPISASVDEADRIKIRSEQRYPAPGEPVCVLCGKYGEYICNETDDDICSTECKVELLQNLTIQEEPQSGPVLVGPFSARRCTLEVPESGGDTYDYDRHCWSKKRSGLCTYECWKCQKPGHLAKDCLVAVPQNSSSQISRDLVNLYKRCCQIGNNFRAAKCNSCCQSTTLASCLSCENTFCDRSGHLSEHIRGHPTHQQYYSYKLKRLVKCCNSNCKVTNIKDLVACHYCFNKAFDKFYDMYSATWKQPGLSIIRNSICCEDHFEWHRMNCFSSDVEDGAYIFKNEHARNEKYVQLSDFIF